MLVKTEAEIQRGHLFHFWSQLERAKGSMERGSSRAARAGAVPTAGSVSLQPRRLFLCAALCGVGKSGR